MPSWCWKMPARQIGVPDQQHLAVLDQHGVHPDRQALSYRDQEQVQPRAPQLQRAKLQIVCHRAGTLAARPSRAKWPLPDICHFLAARRVALRGQ